MLKLLGSKAEKNSKKNVLFSDASSPPDQQQSNQSTKPAYALTEKSIKKSNTLKTPPSLPKNSETAQKQAPNTKNTSKVIATRQQPLAKSVPYKAVESDSKSGIKTIGRPELSSSRIKTTQISNSKATLITKSAASNSRTPLITNKKPYLSSTTVPKSSVQAGNNPSKIDLKDLKQKTSHSPSTQSRQASPSEGKLNSKNNKLIFTSVSSVGIPSRLTSEFSLSPLDLNDGELTLIEMQEISDVEKYKKLKEAYVRQRQIRTKVERENKQLRDHITVLNKRMIRHFKVQKNSIPLEASMNLKNQYQKRVDAEKLRYEELYAQNLRLVAKLKEQESDTIRELADKKPLDKTSEVNLLKTKLKEMEKEKEQAEASLRFMTNEFEGRTKEYENLQCQLDYMKTHFAHLAPKAVQLFETEYMELMEDPTLSKSGGNSQNNEVPKESKKVLIELKKK